MKIVITDKSTFGPYKAISILPDCLMCDGIRLPLIAIGSYEISEDLSLIPGPTDAEIANERIIIQTANRSACTAFIVSLYPEPIQRSAALGVYQPAIVTAMTEHIALIIAEENRVFDLIEAASTIEELNAVESPIWPEAVA